MIIFWNFVVEFGWLVFVELGGEGVILFWLVDVGGEGENFFLGRLFFLIFLFVSVWFGVMVWWWWLYVVEGGLGIGWVFVLLDICLLWSEGFFFKEDCFFDFESFCFGCL